jgi:transcriptional regulator GlxA family with amidase domain
MELLSIIISNLGKKEKNISVVLTKKDKQNLKKVVSAMKKDLSVHIDGIELSKIALMSPARFQLAFRKYYGVPPYEYLKELRLNKALLLLKNSEHSISEISEKVGYSHTGHFAKIFKSTYGITPSKYRRTIL